MASRSEDRAAARPRPGGTSLRHLARIVAAAAALLIGVLAALLIFTARVLHDEVESVARDSTSIRIVEEIDGELWSYVRTSNLLVATGDSSLRAVRERARARVVELIDEGRRASESSSEAALMDRMAGLIDTYFTERGRLEQPDATLRDIVAGTRDDLDRALTSLDVLRSLNQAELERSRSRTATTWRSVSIAGLTAAALLVGGVIILSKLLLAEVVRPLASIHAAIDGSRAAAKRPRIPDVGSFEIRQIAHALNDASDEVERQRHRQLAFLAGVAHDLRTPLGAMKMCVHALGEETEAESPTQRAATLSLLDRQIDRLTRMVTDLVDAARLEAGETALELVDHDLRRTAREIVDLYRPTSVRHRLALVVPDSPVVVRADPLRIEEVLGNLVSNAIKYSPDGGEVKIAVTHEEGEAVLSVSDAGVGISEDESREIFEPFRRSRGSDEIAPGTGLGLSVVARLVAAHGGRIEVTSAPGRGSTFRVRLPLAA